MRGFVENDGGFLRVHAILKKTTSLGPGERFALWLQGCEKNCPGCMSPSSRGLSGGTAKPIEKIAEIILAETGIEGVTISGGEPFLQYRALRRLLTSIREKSGLGVIIYTGYYFDELLKMKIPEIDEILGNLSDVIIDGPYVPDLNDGKSLRGSSNQTINLTSPRYKEIADTLYGRSDRKCEIRLNGKEAFLVGIPDNNAYKMWKQIFEASIGGRENELHLPYMQNKL